MANVAKEAKKLQQDAKRNLEASTNNPAFQVANGLQEVTAVILDNPTVREMKRIEEELKRLSELLPTVIPSMSKWEESDEGRGTTVVPAVDPPAPLPEKIASDRTTDKALVEIIRGLIVVIQDATRQSALIADRANTIADQANTIAEKANTIAWWALLASPLAVIIAAWISWALGALLR